MSSNHADSPLVRVLALASWCLFAGLFLGLVPSRAIAQREAAEPHWIWRQTGKPKGEIAAETAYFRKTFLVKEPSRLALSAAADNEFKLYLDGKLVLEGGEWQAPSSVVIPVSPGPHVLAVSASNEAPGAAGLLVGGGVLPLGQGVPIQTNTTWQATDKVPAGDAWTTLGFDHSTWPKVVDLGALGVAPWGAVALGGDTASRFHAADGLAVETAATPMVTGSVVAFTFDPQGAPCVSIERGPIAKLIDEDNDGQYDRRQTIESQVTNCQGLAFIRDALWVVGEGPQGAGLYRLEAPDSTGVYKRVTMIRLTNGGMGEHGPHAVSLGPDGLLYMNNGNHAHLKPPINPDSPVNVIYEGELLPHYNDPRGHAAGIMAPGGEIMRSADSGATWSRVVAGFRNEYDFAFHADGSLFSFDSDMEWDVGLPWYRPVRVTFCPAGAEFGWRNGSGKWPAYYADSLPAVLNVGRGSPTGVTFYRAGRLPQPYHDNFLICDWSQGRILAIGLERKGASFAATPRELVTGQPLNCTDIEVGPDQAVYFTTGGRGTQGGLFRVVPKGVAAPKANPAVTPRDALALASPLAGFTQRRYAEIKAANPDLWAKTLEQVARNESAHETPADRLRALEILSTVGPSPGDGLLLALAADPIAAVRGRAIGLVGLRVGPAIVAALTKALADPDPFVRRLACEGLMGQPHETIPISALLPLLADDDRFIRGAARTAIEHGDIAASRDAILAIQAPRPLIEGMIALVRAVPLEAHIQTEFLKKEETLVELPLEGPGKLDDAISVDLLRLIELTLIRGPEGRDSQASRGLQSLLLRRFDHRVDSPVMREIARLLAFFNEPRAIFAVLLHQRTVADRQSQIHDAYCLRSFKNGWNPDMKMQLWAWHQAASAWEGGFSFHGYLDFMIQELVARMNNLERDRAIGMGEHYPFPTRVLVRGLDLSERPNMIPEIASLYGRLGSSAVEVELKGVIVEKLGSSDRADARAALRGIYDHDPEHGDLIERALAGRATEADIAILAKGLGSRDDNTVRAVVRGLERLKSTPSGPEPLAALIRAARRMGPGMSSHLNTLASRWTGVAAPAKGSSHDRALAAWESVYHSKYPTGPAIGGDAGSVATAYTLPQLIKGVIEPGLVAKASSERGRAVVKRAKCLDCHKFGAEGQGVGPDLTTLNSRFRPAEVLESIVEPSKVISDQYKPLSVATVDGRILNGMPIGEDPKNLVLLLSDGSKVTIPIADIEEKKASTVSVMPPGLLNSLSLGEIADLLALFESAPRVKAVGSSSP